MRDRLIRIAAAMFAAFLAWPAAAQWNSSAPVPTSPKSLVVESLRLGAGAPSTPLRLDPIDASLIESIKADNGKTFFKRLQIGIGRPVEAGILARSAGLRWVAVDGGLAARWMVTSPGARALRVGLAIARMDPAIEIRFAGTAQANTVYGPFLVHDAMRGGATYWSPVLEGESAIVEVLVPPGSSTYDFDAAIAQVSHLFASPSDPAVESVAKASQPCEVDLICRSATDAALASVGKAVAKMTFSDGVGGGTFLCTGTLLNPIGGSFTPYFYGANHCISTQAAANTLTTHWFYDRTGCSSGGTSPDYVQLPGGAQLLYADSNSDAMLMRLNNTPPPGSVLSGWDASTLATGTAVTAVHHPAGDLKKVSLGTVGGFGDSDGGSTPTFIISNWNSLATGVTEGGSSGSGLFTATAQPPSDYRLRGGLFGGPSSCTASASTRYDYYSRFDQVYPALAQYLNPGTGSCSYALSPASAKVGSGATTGVVTVTATSGCAWSASSNASWLTTSSSGSGNGTVAYAVAANGGAARTGTLTVAGQSFVMNQQGSGTGANVVSNANFETGTAGWTQSASGGFPIITNDASVAHGGAWYAWLGGYDSANDTLYQQIFIPDNASLVTLQFWYNIQTTETSSSAAFDTMTVTLASASTGARLATLATFSNLNRTNGWVQSAQYDVSAYRGQTVRLVFQAITDGSNISSFLVDDVNLAVITTGGAAASYEGLWLKGDESGWGINVTHQGTTLFATWFTYDTDGSGMWLVASNVAQTSTGNFSGTLYRTVGPGFNADPFNSITFPANYTSVGTLSFAFSDANNGTMSYTVNGVSQSKAITRFIFGATGTNCTLGGAQGATPNYQDLWLRTANGGSEAGWGINITHQGDILFATWFTYQPGSGSTNKGLWLVMSNGNKTAPGVYSGALQTTTGPAFSATPFNPNSVVRTTVGNGTFTFTDANNGTFNYTVNGITQSKPIARYIYASPSTVCQ